jgi:hypothetical protein
MRDLSGDDCYSVLEYFLTLKMRSKITKFSSFRGITHEQPMIERLKLIRNGSLGHKPCPARFLQLARSSTLTIGIITIIVGGKTSFPTLVSTQTIRTMGSVLSARGMLGSAGEGNVH